MSCPDCFTGTVHEGTPVGHVETIHGLPTYVAGTTSETEPEGIIVIISDAFGWDLLNSRILADAYAKRGTYTVYLPDFMDGTLMPLDPTHPAMADARHAGHCLPHDLLQDISIVTNPGSSSYLGQAIAIFRTAIHFLPWLVFTRSSVTEPRIISFFSALRTSTNLPIGAAGFCWGGRIVTDFCDGRTAPNGQPLIDAGFAAHPSNLAVPRAIEPLKVPYSVCIGDVDHGMPIEQVRNLENLLKGLRNMEGKWDLVVVEGARHGFAVRGDPRHEKEAKQVSDHLESCWETSSRLHVFTCRLSKMTDSIRIPLVPAG